MRRKHLNYKILLRTLGTLVYKIEKQELYRSAAFSNEATNANAAFADNCNETDKFPIVAFTFEKRRHRRSRPTQITRVSASPAGQLERHRARRNGRNYSYCRCSSTGISCSDKPCVEILRISSRWKFIFARNACQVEKLYCLKQMRRFTARALLFFLFRGRWIISVMRNGEFPNFQLSSGAFIYFTFAELF